MTCHAVIAGGGTSGHVIPALAIAEALVDDGIDMEQIVYFGALRGVETTLVPPTGLRHEFFDVVGVKREMSWVALKNNISFVPRMLRARRRAIAFFEEHRPRVVISVGGYASLPAVLAARRCGVPIVVVSYDRRPGRSSKWAARRAARCAVAFPNSELPRSEWTGAPVRRAIREIDRKTDRERSRRKWGIRDDTFLIGVIGGSLGSGILNEAVAAYAQAHRGDGTLAIHHVVGKRFYGDYARQGSTDSHGLDYRVVAYEDDMVTLLSSVDLLIGRGGAGTVAEVSTVGVPAILVPWSGAADDHQRENVRWLSDMGAAILLEESDITSHLSNMIDDLRVDPAALEEMSRRAREAGERHRSNGIARVIAGVCRKDVQS